ncbi:MAG: DUF2948 family protein [Paracoccaceae bacterium]
MADARFEDGGEGPLRLIAQEADDVGVLSALLQDAVLPVAEIRLDRKRRRLVALVNRFRWEDRDAAAIAGRPFERVRSLLTIEDVLAARTMGIDPTSRDTVLSILSLDWTPGDDGTGRLVLVLAGDGAMALDVETLEIRLDDVTRPYIAPSRRAPDHGA